MSTPQIGAVPGGIKTRVINESMKEWSETPFFMATEDASKLENAQPIAPGQKLAGKFIVLRQTQDKKNHYLCLEDYGGQKFRVRAGKVLRDAVATLAVGTGLVLTYNGSKQSNTTENTYHDFTVEVIEGAVN